MSARASTWIALVVLCAGALTQACTTETIVSVGVGSVVVLPGIAVELEGGTARFSAEVRDEDGWILTQVQVRWSSSSPSVATVDGEGIVSAVAPGQAEIRATTPGGVTGQATLTVEKGPTISVDQAALAFLAPIQGVAPNPEVVWIRNVGGGTLTGISAEVAYTDGQPTGWLTPSLASTTAPSTLTVSAFGGSLPVGSYSALISVRGENARNNPVDLPVTLTVVDDRPILGLSPAAVGLVAERHGQPVPSVAVQVLNEGGGILTGLRSEVFYPSGEGAWLSASLAGAEAPTELHLQADPGDLPDGEHLAEVVVYSVDNPEDSAAVAVSLTVVPGPTDLRIEKSGPAQATVGELASYIITVTNDGPNQAQSVRIRDLLPEGVTFETAEPSPASVSGRIVTWPELPALAAGAETTLSLTLRVEPGIHGSITNHAEVEAVTPDPVPANNSTSATTAVLESADVRIGLEGPDSVKSGDEVAYAITVTNTGPSPALALRVSDRMPPGVTLVSADPALETVQDGVASWPIIAVLPSNSSLSFGLTVRVDSLGSLSLENEATAVSTTPDPNPSDNTARWESVLGASADLRILKTGPEAVKPGQKANYRLTVTNIGEHPADKVRITDQLPPGMTFLKAKPAQESEAEGLITWPEIDTLQPGEEIAFTLVGQVDPGAFGSLTNQAWVASSTPDADPSNNASSVSTTVITEADLSAEIGGSILSFVGGSISYRGSVTNAGPDMARKVVAKAVLPEGTSLTSASGEYEYADGVVKWTWDALPVGATQSLSLETLVGKDVPGGSSVVLTLNVTAGTTDPKPANNRAEHSTWIVW